MPARHTRLPDCTRPANGHHPLIHRISSSNAIETLFMNARAVSIATFLALPIAPAAIAADEGEGRTEATAGSAKHIILFIGDGMNIEHEIAASRYLRGRDFALTFDNFPYQGNVATWDVTTYKHWSGGTYEPQAILPTYGYDPKKGGKAPYPLGPELNGAKAYHMAKATDSASAATAWATGYKTDDGNLAWLPGDPADGALETIAETLRNQLGYAIGVVSTVPFTHATPAAHVSHNVSRSNYLQIASEILTDVKPDVVIGGGHPGNDGSPSYNWISETDYSNARDGIYSDYVFVERQAGQDGGLTLLSAAQEAAASGKKLFGLFGLEEAGNFDSPKPNDLPGTPSVKAVTNENPTLTEATQAALKVLSQDKDGFFVMIEQGDIDWANHANDFQRMVGTVADLDNAIKAAVAFVNQSGDDMDWSNTLLISTSDHSNSYLRNRARLPAGDLPRQDQAGSTNTYDPKEVTYGSGSHTNELTRLYAKGAGSRLFKRYEKLWYPNAQILDNTHIYHVMRDAAGIPIASPLTLAPQPTIRAE